MPIDYGHEFKLEAGGLIYEGEVDLVSCVYSEDQPEELPARLETDFKQLVEIMGKFYNEFGSLEFEIKEKAE